MALTVFDAWLCTDCGMILANGDDSGIEDAAAHHAAMAAEAIRRGPGGGALIVSGCSEDGCEFAPATICGACDPADLGLVDQDECDHGEPDNDHECRFDRHFSTERCDGCGTTLAGHRFAAVEHVDGLPE